MTPAEKAKQLVYKFYFSLPNNGGFTGLCNINDRWEEGKKCALIAVDEILDIIEDDGFTFAEYHDKKTIEYWLEVKQEINKNYVRNTNK